MRFDVLSMGGASSLGDVSLDAILAQARLVEALGFHGYWGSDHQYALSDKFRPHLDRYIALTAVAMATARIRIGPLVTGNTYRHPVILAKLATGVDIASNGRLDLGIGTGWTKPEHEAYGIPFPSYAERLGRLDETLTILKLLWTERESDFAGRYHRLRGAPFEPKPVQRPHPPRVVGGNSTPLLRVVARNAEQWAAGMGSPRFLEERAKRFEICCREIGRDPATVARSTIVNVKFLETSQQVATYKRTYLAGQKRLVEAGHAQKIKWIGAGEDPWEGIWNMMLVGTPGHIARGLRRLGDMGFDRIMLGIHDDSDLRRFASEVAPVLSD